MGLYYFVLIVYMSSIWYVNIYVSLSTYLSIGVTIYLPHLSMYHYLVHLYVCQYVHLSVCPWFCLLICPILPNVFVNHYLRVSIYLPHLSRYLSIWPSIHITLFVCSSICPPVNLLQKCNEARKLFSPNSKNLFSTHFEKPASLWVTSSTQAFLLRTLVVFFINWAILALFFTYFCLFNTVVSKLMFDKNLPMLGFELRDLWCRRRPLCHWTTTTALILKGLTYMFAAILSKYIPATFHIGR